MAPCLSMYPGTLLRLVALAKPTCAGPALALPVCQPMSQIELSTVRPYYVETRNCYITLEDQVPYLACLGGYLSASHAPLHPSPIRRPGCGFSGPSVACRPTRNALRFSAVSGQGAISQT